MPKTRSLRVLVACEFSGTVRDAFITRGHEAVSCDLMPTEVSGPHIQGDVLSVLADGWDLLIGHPPCTHLAVSGARWFKEKKNRQRNAIEFFLALWQAPVCHVALENPVGIMSRPNLLGPPNCIIQPWQFGEPETKRTCLWLRRLPVLKATKIMPKHRRGDNLTPSGQNNIGPGGARAGFGRVERWAQRSKTYRGVAEAMADQWGAYVQQYLCKGRI